MAKFLFKSGQKVGKMAKFLAKIVRISLEILPIRAESPIFVPTFSFRTHFQNPKVGRDLTSFHSLFLTQIRLCPIAKTGTQTSKSPPDSTSFLICKYNSFLNFESSQVTKVEDSMQKFVKSFVLFLRISYGFVYSRIGVSFCISS